MVLDYLSVDPEIAKQLDCDPALKDYVEGMAVACHALFPKSTVNVCYVIDPDEGSDEEIIYINSSGLNFDVRMEYWDQLSDYSQGLWNVIVGNNNVQSEPPFPVLVW